MKRIARLGLVSFALLMAPEGNASDRQVAPITAHARPGVTPTKIAQREKSA